MGTVSGEPPRCHFAAGTISRGNPINAPMSHGHGFFHDPCLNGYLGFPLGP